jgi:seryl-tRNA(Sec) selenium transferase
MAPSAGRRADGGKTRDACADHQHLGRRHLAGGGHLAGKEAAEIVARLDHRAVAGDVGHRRQRVHLLRAEMRGTMSMAMTLVPALVAAVISLPCCPPG